MFEPVVHLAYS